MKSIKNQNGIAMMMAIATMVVLSILAAELVYQSSVYNGVVFRQVDQLRARLLARSALRLALMQLKAAEKAKTTVKNMGLSNGDGVTDRIWQTPLILPPPEPKGLSQSDQNALKEFRKSLGLEGTLSVSIMAESDRMNLNNLVWLTKAQEQSAATNGVVKKGDQIDPNTGLPISEPTNPAPTNLDPEKKKDVLKEIRKTYVEVLDKILEQKKKSDDEFRERFATVTGETLIGNLVAWMDPETKLDGDNREKEDYYSRLENPYGIKNAPLSSESELYMVKGFADPIAKLVLDNFSIQQSAGINPNKASLTLLQALIPELHSDDLEKLDKRRNEKEFAKADDFWSYLETFGNFKDVKKRLDDKGIKFLEQETSYRVVVSAQSGQASKTWVALLGEAPPPIAGTSQTSAPPKTSTEEKTSPETEKSTGKSDNKSLNIIYLKAD